jgi:hypothetical protein
VGSCEGKVDRKKFRNSTKMKQIKRINAEQVYLEDDLRIDFSAVQNIDLDIISQYVEVGKKKGELRLLKFLKTIR